MVWYHNSDSLICNIRPTFFSFCRYLYTDICDVNFENAMDLLYIAKKYCVDLLANSCLKFLKDVISPDTVCQILEASRAISESEVHDQCISFIKENFLVCLKSKDFAALSMQCLEDVTAINTFWVKEEELYENLMRWAESECHRQKLDVSWGNKRKVLGGILYKVRFPLMEPDYFSRKVATTELLSDGEKIDVFLYHCTKEDIVPKYFQATERIHHVMRFGQASTSSSVNMTIFSAAISFKVSHDSCLHGILIYGCNTGRCKYDVEIQVKAHDKEICFVKTEINTSSDTKVYKIKLDSNLHLEAGKDHVVHLDMDGNKNTYKGEHEISCVSFDHGKSVTFKHVPVTTKTNEVCFQYGQIPGLLLT